MTYRPTLYASLDKGWVRRRDGANRPVDASTLQAVMIKKGLGGRDGRDGGRPSINGEALLCLTSTVESGSFPCHRPYVLQYGVHKSTKR